MRIRSAARSNSCLHLFEQKKYRRFLYSLLGVPSPLSTGTPQIGSYDRPFVLLSPEFTCRPPALSTPRGTTCKRDAAVARPVTAIALREALPRVGIPVLSPDGGALLRGRRRRRAHDPRRALRKHLRRPRARRSGAHGRLRRAKRRLRAQEQPCPEEQRASGLAGEEETSHAQDQSATRLPMRSKRALGCSPPQQDI